MPDDNSFQTILGTGSIVVQKLSTYDIDDQRVEIILLTVLDPQGRVADEHSSSEEESAKLWELFQKARSAARNSDLIIGHLLEEIG